MKKASNKRTNVRAYIYRKIKSKQAKLMHKILFRDMHIHYKANKQKKGNGMLKIQDSSYLEREQEEELAIKKGNTRDFEDSVIFYFSSYILSYLNCIHTLYMYINDMLHKHLQRLSN